MTVGPQSLNLRSLFFIPLIIAAGTSTKARADSTQDRWRSSHVWNANKWQIAAASVSRPPLMTLIHWSANFFLRLTTAASIISIIGYCVVCACVRVCVCVFMCEWITHMTWNQKSVPWQGCYLLFLSLLSSLRRQCEFNFTVVMVRPGLHLALRTLMMTKWPNVEKVEEFEDNEFLDKFFAWWRVTRLTLKPYYNQILKFQLVLIFYVFNLCVFQNENLLFAENIWNEQHIDQLLKICRKMKK